ncbi:MAG: molybdopterin-binding protein, partial [Thermodesulfobacteriota bacterium]|nr:molybdopterin-binding protein [Thermodesulfobacteriota bacterium]
MRGEIITIGDELISGRVCDQNAHFLSGRLTSFGLEVTAISSVGDDPDHIRDVLTRASARSEFVIVCGGLGPTEDDITTQVAADFFKRPLILDQPYLDFLRHSVESRGLPWVE